MDESAVSTVMKTLEVQLFITLFQTLYLLYYYKWKVHKILTTKLPAMCS